MRNSTLHALLKTFASDAAAALCAETAAGAEIPFELVEAGRGSSPSPLLCYRPLTGDFIHDRLQLLSALDAYAPAVRALAGQDGIERYLQQRGVYPVPHKRRERSAVALECFLEAMFAERGGFTFEPRRFAAAYAELERVVYEGRGVSTVIAPVLGLALDPDSREVALGDGLALVRGETFEGAPPEAVRGTVGLEGPQEPNVLAVLTVAEERRHRPPVSLARARFRRLLTCLRLFERGGYALGPLAWIRADEGVWRPVAIGSTGRPGLVTVIEAAQEDELRAFCNLVARCVPGRRGGSPAGPASGAASLGGEGPLAWALARYEMGCERLTPYEALSDYLLALRALLEPEGTHSGRLPERLAVLCAAPERRLELAERAERSIALEHAVITGIGPSQTEGAGDLVRELSEHLRALLRDVICGHLDVDLVAVADELLAEAHQAPADTSPSEAAELSGEAALAGGEAADFTTDAEPTTIA